MASPGSKRLRAFTALALVAGIGAIGWIANATQADLHRPRDLHEVEHTGSSSCRPCHEDHYASWHRTFHRTMTQEASEEAVMGDFGGARLLYRGVTATMSRGEDGGYRMAFDGPGAPRTVDVVRVVGSHRYQQYLAREQDAFVRLPLAWHIEDQRWFHMNGAFLTADPPLPISREHYDRHVVRWNDNCVFCHNVGPNPGFDPSTGTFETEVAELGIACEACHGPGAEHAAANRNPVRRFALHGSDTADPTIVNPERLTPARSAEVCGRCHGQRITADIARFLEDGDPYVPGDELADYSAPLFRDTTLNDETGVFATRFWTDGTPRLTAYEYQGLLQSACVDGGLTCTTCHGMHEGDPRGQMRPDALGDDACTHCHVDLASDDAKTAHSDHDMTTECVTCHMPRVVYGLVDVHRSHHIEIPDAEAAARIGRPDACTLCHVQRSRRWAMQTADTSFDALDVPIASNAATPAELSPAALSPAALSPAALSPAALSEVQRMLLSGDPIERAVAAAALGRTNDPEDERDLPERVGFLLDAMAQDRYPAVRRIAWRSLHNLDVVRASSLQAYEPTAQQDARVQTIERITRDLSVTPRAPAPELAAALRAVADQGAIEIGE